MDGLTISRRMDLASVPQDMFPNVSVRQYISDLKRGPVQTLIESLIEKVVINGTGIRAEGASSWAKRSLWKFDR